MIPAAEALERLREGNRRFASEQGERDRFSVQARRRSLTERQEPFAIVLGCSDSRVPAEMVFDQSLGDLFVIRVAGNIVAPSQVGSIEFAAEQFGTRLVVVLGHSRCGAVVATLDELQRPIGGTHSRHLRSIVDRIRPAVEGLLPAPGSTHDQLVERAVRANILASAEQLRHGSEILEQRIDSDGLMVVAAEYSLETGLVEFLIPAPARG